MINANMYIEVMIECPHCEHYYNLFDDTHLLDDAWLYGVLVPRDAEKTWGCKNFYDEYLESHGECYKCVKCGKENDL